MDTTTPTSNQSSKPPLLHPGQEILPESGEGFAGDIGVVVCTFGDRDEWWPLVCRAADSVVNQTVPPRTIRWIHDKSLQQARNKALFHLDTEWVIFLDADDELDEHYIEAMMAGSGDIRQPSTLGIQNGVPDDYPVLLSRRDLYEGNYIVIGAMCRTQAAMAIGGFRDLPVLEDWDFWIRMVLTGNKVEPCPDAIYKVHVNPQGRNNTPWQSVYTGIRHEYTQQRKLLS
jgi:glycosyltransferase involved in cell wall biosynthesis